MKVKKPKKKLIDLEKNMNNIKKNYQLKEKKKKLQDIQQENKLKNIKLKLKKLNVN